MDMNKQNRITGTSRASQLSQNKTSDIFRKTEKSWAQKGNVSIYIMM